MSDSWQAPGGPRDPQPERDSSGSYGPPPPPPPPTRHAPSGGHPSPPPSGWRPGVVPIMPLVLSDMFGGAARTMRNNPGATIGLGLLVSVAAAVPTALVQLGVLNARLDVDVEVLNLLYTLVPTLFSFLAAQVLSGLIVRVVSEASLGTKMSIGEAWSATRGRLVPLIGLGLLTGLILLLVAGVPFALIVWAAVAGANSAGAAVGLLLLGFLLVLAIVLLVNVKFLLAAPALVLEERGVIASIRRGFELTSGAGPFWRVFGINLLTNVVVFVIGLVLGAILLIPLSFGLGYDALGFPDNGTVVAEALFSALGAAVTAPFAAGVLCLLYLDQRIRREGLDITMMAEAQRRASGPQV